jgi:hypothetical protein
MGTRAELEIQIDILLSLIDELKREMIPSDLDEDLNREELETCWIDR